MGHFATRPVPSFGTERAPSVLDQRIFLSARKVDGYMDFANGDTKTPTMLRLRLRFFVWFLATVLLVLTTASVVVLLDLGKWLVREDPLQPATAIAVLSGGLPARALEAAQLYHEGYAKEIWLTHPGQQSGQLKALGIAYPAEDDLNARVLRREGVPAKAIHVLDYPVSNTDEELDVISSVLVNRGGQRVIIVTNKSHTRRVHLLWKKYFGNRGGAIVHAVSDDPFEARAWWHTPGDLTQVVHEVAGIVNTWANLPVKPREPSAEAFLAKGSESWKPDADSDADSSTD